MCVTTIFYVLVGEWMEATPRQLNTALYNGMLIFALLIGLIIVVTRKLTIDRALEVLKHTPDNMAALYRWRSGNILSFALAESIVLYGFVVRFLGASLAQAAPFYIAGIIILAV